MSKLAKEQKPQFIAKEKQVAELQQLISESEAVFLTNYCGITVDKDVALRAKLRNAGVDYRVAKNTLLRIACDNLGDNCLDEYFNGPTAVAFAKDPAAAAKILSEFIRDNKVTSFKAGLLGGKFIDAKGIDTLGKLPPREILLAQVAGCFAAPMAALARVTNLVKEAKEAAEAAPAAE